MNHAESIKWIRKAAEQGVAEAQCNLCRSYQTGIGVTKDFAKAIEWCKKAAEQGHGEAKALLELLLKSTD